MSALHDVQHRAEVAVRKKDEADRRNRRELDKI